MAAIHSFRHTRRPSGSRFPPLSRTAGTESPCFQSLAATPPHLPDPPAGENTSGPLSCSIAPPFQTPDPAVPSPCCSHLSGKLAPHPLLPEVGATPDILPSPSGPPAHSRLYQHGPLPKQTTCSTPSCHPCPPHPLPLPGPLFGRARYTLPAQQRGAPPSSQTVPTYQLPGPF